MIITKESLARDAAYRWKMQYPEGATHVTKAQARIGEMLELVTGPDEVNRLIGNDSWTRITCEECDKDVNAAAVYGNHYPVYVCLDCLKKSCEEICSA